MGKVGGWGKLESDDEAKDDDGDGLEWQRARAKNPHNQSLREVFSVVVTKKVRVLGCCLCEVWERSTRKMAMPCTQRKAPPQNNLMQQPTHTLPPEAANARVARGEQACR